MAKCRHSSEFFFCVVAFLLVANLGMAQNGTAEVKPLQILVPVRNFTDFVTIKKDPVTGDYTYDGFAIRVFRAVMNTTRIRFEFVRFDKPDGSMNGTFDDMLQKVSSSEFQGAVGEISILYERAHLVDFTMPYLDTSISMLVRLKRGPTKNSVIHLGTVTKYVVASSLSFSFIVALLFWFLEYRNDKHTSPPEHSSRNHDDNWQREMMGSLVQTRLVMILFFMLLLVLMACYTASQTSLLTNQRPGGVFKSLDELMSKKANIGYRDGSFIRDMLIRKGIDKSNLINLYSEEELVSALSKGTANGGVDAIFADTPSLNLLVAKHCDVFTIVPTYNLHVAGFGFAFYTGYKEVKDISKGILKIIDNGRLAEIQARTIGSLQGCQNDPNIVSGSAYLDSDTLWILVAGTIAVFLLIIIVLLIYCGNRSKTRTNKAVAYPCYLSPCC